jgi:uncharacterized protein involved in exopolysaccharide biosynthesis
MKEAQIAAHGSASEHVDDGVSVIDVLIALARHKKLIIGLPLVVGLVAAAVSFALPNIYKANTKLLPPQQSQPTATALLSQLGGVAGLAAGAAGLKSPADLYVGMLKSRTVADRLIAEFQLKKVYDVDLQEKARKELEARTTINSGKDGLITIEVEDEGQERVAKLANAYVAELGSLTKVLAVTEAAQRRLFFERQLELSKNNLAKAEIALKGALDNSGVISVDSESRAVVETIARVNAQISAKEIKLGSMRAFVTSNHPEYRATAEELNSLRAELSKLENGRVAGGERGRAADTPTRGFENIQLLRDVKYYQMLYELLAKQYEAARLDEAKDPSIIQVLDPAVAPERKFRPKRAIIVIGSTVGALFFAMFYALLLESKRRALLAPATAGRWAELKSHFGLGSK